MTTETSSARESRGVALLCDGHGHIRQVLRDTLDAEACFATGQLLTACVEPASARQASEFLQTLATRGAAFNWALQVRVGQEVAVVHFAGGSAEGGFLIVGAPSRSGAVRLYDELVRINNEQSTALRTALKDLALQTRERDGRDAELMEELSRLNNELTTTQRDLARKNAELARLNEQKNAFLGIAAHDLRNPLDVIAAYSGFLLEEAAPKLEPQHRVFLDRIRGSSEFMRNLVDDLLDVSRIEAGRLDLQLESLDPGELVERAVVLNRVLAERKNIAIELEKRETGRIRVDAARIEQVLNNLVGNAMKFSPPGSTIRVSVVPAEAGGVQIEVSDQGPGVPSGELHRLFEPFQQTSVRSTGGEKGAGLGLAIVRHIVSGHGGRIGVASRPGEGSTFTVYLPASGPGV